MPATFHRYDGVRHLLAYYDVHANYLDGWLHERKRGEEFLDFLQRIRLRYAEQNLVIVLAFERHGINAVHEGTRTKAYTMSPEERSLIVEMGRLTPRAFGIDRDGWLLSQLRDLAAEQNSLRVVNLDGIRSALTDAQLPYDDDLP